LAFPATQDLFTQQRERFRDLLSAFVAPMLCSICLLFLFGSKMLLLNFLFVKHFLRLFEWVGSKSLDQTKPHLSWAEPDFYHGPCRYDGSWSLGGNFPLLINFQSSLITNSQSINPPTPAIYKLERFRRKHAVHNIEG
jgi:hypothetical protein